MPIFCCKVSPLMPSSCPSSSVSCILPCQQYCCQERYPPNSSTQSPAICPSQCAIHCEHMWPAHCFPASSQQLSFLTKMSSQTFCCCKGMQHLHHMPQFLLVVMFTQIAPVQLHGATKVSIPIQNPGTNITGWKVSWRSRSQL